jgi:hypothetical protein
VRLELGVDKQHSFFAYKYADVRKSVGALNHMHASGDWHDFEFHVVEAVVKLGDCVERGQGGEQENPCDRSGHILFPELNFLVKSLNCNYSVADES